MTIITIVFTITVCLLQRVESTNFTQLPAEVTKRIMSDHLPSKERQTTFRLINQQCNRLFNQHNQNQLVINNLQQLQSLISSIDQLQIENDTVQQIANIYKESKFHELFILNRPKLMHQLVVPRSFNDTIDMMDANGSYINNVHTVRKSLHFEGQTESSVRGLSLNAELDYFTKMLIRQSKQLAFHQEISQHSMYTSHRPDMHRFFYQHCYNYLMIRNNLPSITNIFSQQITKQQSVLLTHLIDDFGLILFHPNALKRSWNAMHVGYVFMFHGISRNIIQQGEIEGNAEYVFFMDALIARFIMELLENERFNFRIMDGQLRTGSGRGFEIIVNYLQRSLMLFYGKDPAIALLTDDLTDIENPTLLFLKRLKNNNGLKLLSHNGFLRKFLTLDMMYPPCLMKQLIVVLFNDTDTYVKDMENII